MINKKGKCTNKLGICLNVLLHYNKYKKLVGRQVEIIKNDGLSKYDDLIGEIGYVCNFEFENFKKPLIVHFPKTKKEYCFGIDELKLFRRQMMKLEVGMYVRTTYGIGRIVNAYIVYDDCGGLWHLSYMTDNPKIEVSIYTKNDSWELFGEVQKDHRIKYEPLENDFDLVKKVYEQELEEIVCYVPVNKSYPRNASLYDDHKFIKASYNIIDILEVGDYVNGYKVEKVNNNLSEHKGICNSLDTYLWGINDLDEFEKIVIFENDIKSVVTKEEFESMKYRIEGE